MPPSPSAPCDGQELRDRAAVEQPTLDRGALQHRPLARLEAVDAGGEERVDRRRHASRLPRRDRRRAWRASARRTAGCPRPRRRCGRGAPKRRLRRPAARRSGRSDSSSLSGESETSARTRPGRSPGRPGVEEVRAREAEEQDRGAAREAERRTRAGRAASARPSGCRPPRRRAVARRASVSKSRRNAQAVSSGEPGSSFAPIAPMISRVATGPRSTFARSAASAGSGSAPAISRTTSASGRYVMPSPYATQRPTTTRASCSSERTSLAREAGLADPGRPDDRGEPARRLAHRGVERVAELVELRVGDRRRAWRSGARTPARPAAGRAASRRTSGRLLPFASTRRRRLRRRPRPGRGRTSPRRGAPRPARAACSSRAATLTASPVASF